MALLGNALHGDDGHISVDTGLDTMLFLGRLPQGPQSSSFPSPEKPKALQQPLPALASLKAGFSENREGHLSPGVLAALERLTKPLLSKQKPRRLHCYNYLREFQG